MTPIYIAKKAPAEMPLTVRSVLEMFILYKFLFCLARAEKKMHVKVRIKNNFLMDF